MSRLLIIRLRTDNSRESQKQPNHAVSKGMIRRRDIDSQVQWLGGCSECFFGRLPGDYDR
jgi:hypothetical protein